MVSKKEETMNYASDLKISNKKAYLSLITTMQIKFHTRSGWNRAQVVDEVDNMYLYTNKDGEVLSQLDETFTDREVLKYDAINNFWITTQDKLI